MPNIKTLDHSLSKNIRVVLTRFLTFDFSFFYNFLAYILLKIMALQFSYRRKFNQLMMAKEGWVHFSLGISTDDQKINQAICFSEGRVYVPRDIPQNLDANLIFKNTSVAMQMLNMPPNEVMNLLLKNKMRITGNAGYVSLFNFYLSALMFKKISKQMMRAHLKTDIPNISQDNSKNKNSLDLFTQRNTVTLKGDCCVEAPFLPDPYLSRYDLASFPRLKNLLDQHFTVRPEICIERPRLLTEWYQKNGFEEDPQGKPWNEISRQAQAFNFLMKNRKAIIQDQDLLAGTSSTKKIGVLLYPDGVANYIWGELNHISLRELNPYNIDPQEKTILHHDIFPFWQNRTFKEWVRNTYQNPLCKEIDDRFAVYFVWKSAALSHTIADFPKLLRLGTKGFKREINESLLNAKLTAEKKNLLEGMKLCLEGLECYAHNMQEEIKKQISREKT